MENKTPKEEQISLPYSAGKNDPQLRFIVNKLKQAGKPLKVCDFGCGEALFLAAIEEHNGNSAIASYLGIDRSGKMVDFTQNKLSELAVFGGVLKKNDLSLDDHKHNYDMAILHDVLHEIQGKELHDDLQLIFGLLKPNGTLYIGDLKFFLWHETDFVFWDKSELQRLFSEDCFQLECVTQSNPEPRFLAEVSLKEGAVFPEWDTFRHNLIDVYTSKANWAEKELEKFSLGNLNAKDKIRRNQLESIRGTCYKYILELEREPFVPSKDFVGRRRELDEINSVITAGTHSIINIFGCGGMGKTRLLAELGKYYESKYHILPEPHAATVPPGVPVLEHLANAFNVPLPEANVSRPEYKRLVLEGWVKRLEDCTLVRLDTVAEFKDKDYEDLAEICDFFHQFVRFSQKTLFLVLSTRNKIKPDPSTEFHPVHLEGFDAIDEVQSLAEQSIRWQKSQSSEEYDLLKNKTNGNPKLIKLLTANSDIWDKVKAGLDIYQLDEPAGDFLEQLWENWPNDIQNAVARLSAISKFEESFDEVTAKIAWKGFPKLRRSLLEHDAVQSKDDRFYLHDFIHPLAYAKLVISLRHKTHSLLGDFYRKGNQPVLALRHYARSGNWKLIARFYPKLSGFLKHEYRYPELRLAVEELLAQPAAKRPKELHLRLLFDHARTLGWMDELDRELATYEQIESLADSPDHKPYKADAIWGQGDTLRLLNRHSKALGKFQQTEKLSQDIDYKPNVADAIKGQGEALRMLDRYPEALEKFQQAEDLSQNIGYKLGIANAVKGQGTVLQLLDRCPEALEKYEQAEKLYQNIDDKLGVANAFWGQGEALQLLDRYPEALEKLQVAEKLYQEIGFKMGIANAIKGQGEALQLLDRCNEAMEKLQQAEKLSQDIGYKLGIANAILGQGDTLRMLDRYPEALEKLQQAETLYQEIGFKRGLANTYWGYGNLYLAQKDKPTARKYYLSLQDLARTIGYPLGLRQAEEGLKQCGD